MSYNLRLNQVTLGAIDTPASVAFYKNLGLTVIVDSSPRYVRLEFPAQNDGSEPDTLSLHGVSADWRPGEDWPLIYFEVDDLDKFISEKQLSPIEPPALKSYAWKEADILDPAGNRIRLLQAGKNRRFPPWRVK